MQHHYRESRGKSTRKGVRREESARKNIVSVRVSDHEKQVLERITKSTHKNVSDLVREAIEFWVSNRNRFRLEGA